MAFLVFAQLAAEPESYQHDEADGEDGESDRKRDVAVAVGEVHMMAGAVIEQDAQYSDEAGGEE